MDSPFGFRALPRWVNITTFAPKQPKDGRFNNANSLTSLRSTIDVKPIGSYGLGSARQDTKLPQKDLKTAGLKVTLPRLKVLEVLEAEGPHHLSAEDVYRKLIATDEAVGLATVYRVLTQFEAAGIVERHNFDDGHAVYELANETHHDHMVDIDTGVVTEFVSDNIENLQKELAGEYGFELVDHELVLYVRKRAET